MKSVQQMLSQVEGLLGTEDLSGWEQEFLESIVDRMNESKGMVNFISSKQLQVIEKIYNRHFV